MQKFEAYTTKSVCMVVVVLRHLSVLKFCTRFQFVFTKNLVTREHQQRLIRSKKIKIILRFRISCRTSLFPQLYEKVIKSLGHIAITLSRLAESLSSS